MGYYSTWTGELKFNPPITAKTKEFEAMMMDDDWQYGEVESDIIEKVFESEGVSYIAAANIITGVDFSSDDSGKAYGLEEHIEKIVNWVAENSESEVAGCVMVYGEDNTDIWRVRVENNNTIKEKAIFRWPDETKVER